MTKLERKLIELGYEKYDDCLNVYIKKTLSLYYIAIFVNNLENSRVWAKQRQYYVQQDIDNLQQAFNEMQKDLEELKKYEKGN